MVSIFVEMNENLKILIEKFSKIGNSSPLSQGSISDSGNRSFVGNKRQKTCKRCKREIDEDYTGCPHCGNNTFE
jgi:Zn finger protein HypA/HybF involved in hydrogenase expression